MTNDEKRIAELEGENKALRDVVRMLLGPQWMTWQPPPVVTPYHPIPQLPYVPYGTWCQTQGTNGSQAQALQGQMNGEYSQVHGAQLAQV